MTLSAERPRIRHDDPVEVARGLARKWQAGLVERDRAGGSATEEREDLRASGLLSLTIPARYGGWGADWPTAFEVVREIAKADGSLGHLYGYHLSNLPFGALLGTPEQAERIYTEAAANHWWTGNASSENNGHVLEWRVSATPTGDGGYEFNGIKHFSSGAKGSDRLLVFGVVQEDGPLQGAVITAFVPTDRAGISVNDDWQALGQRRTDSGTTEFHQVRVRPDEVLGAPNAVLEQFAASRPASLWTALVQLTFATLYLGIAHGAVEAAAQYTRTQSRPWPSAGVQRAVDDPYVIRAYGEFGIELQGADAAAREAVRLLQELWDKGDALTPPERGELATKVAGVKALATRVGLDVSGRIFEVIGARGTHPRHGLDRFWRNIRTHTLHDPVAYKIADVGQYVLNGRHPQPGLYS